MDARHFDTLVKALAGPDSRRRVLALLTTLPVAMGLVGILDPGAADADGRRKRRKKRHKHGDGRRRNNGKRKKKQKRCTPEPVAQLCVGKCGKVTNNCREPVECGSCDCSPACTECFTCQGAAGAPGTCVPQQAGTPCGDPATCESGTLLPRGSCNGHGVCEAAGPISCAPYLHCDGNACATSCAGDADCSDVCCHGACQECCENSDCGGDALCVDGSCHACNVTCAGAPAACGDALRTALAGSTPTLYVCPGIYAGGFTIGREVTVIGAGPDQTILDGEDQQRVMEVTAGPVILQALRITRGRFVEGGGGILSSSTSLTLRNTVVCKNGGSHGAGIRVDSGSLALEGGTSIEENIASEEGGGAYVISGTLSLQDGSQIVDNTSTNAGGGIYNYVGEVTLESGSRVATNDAGSYGGGIMNEGGKVTLKGGSRLSQNTASVDGGGIFRLSGSTTTLEPGAVVCQNSATQCTGFGSGKINGTCPYPADNVCPD